MADIDHISLYRLHHDRLVPKIVAFQELKVMPTFHYRHFSTPIIIHALIEHISAKDKLFDFVRPATEGRNNGGFCRIIDRPVSSRLYGERPDSKGKDWRSFRIFFHREINFSLTDFFYTIKIGESSSNTCVPFFFVVAERKNNIINSKWRPIMPFRIFSNSKRKLSIVI